MQGTILLFSKGLKSLTPTPNSKFSNIFLGSDSGISNIASLKDKGGFGGSGGELKP